MTPTMLKIETTVIRLRHPARFAAARRALYQKGVDNGAFWHRDGQAKIEDVDVWLVRPGDYGYDFGIEVIPGVRLYGEY